MLFYFFETSAVAAGGAVELLLLLRPVDDGYFVLPFYVEVFVEDPFIGGLPALPLLVLVS